MDRWGMAIVIAALAVAFAGLLIQITRAGRTRATNRAAYFDRCADAFSGPRLTTAPTGFPRLAGDYRGFTFHLQAVPDTLTFRKLPALWVLVTLPARLPVGATLDVMIRPMGVEPFSNYATLPDQIAPPPGYPEDCAIRTDDPAALPSQELLQAHMDLFDDPLVKELIISPNGLRLVFLAEEADRGGYLLFRNAEVGQTPLPAERLTPYLDRLIALRADVLASAQEPRENTGS